MVKNNETNPILNLNVNFFDPFNVTSSTQNSSKFEDDPYTQVFNQQKDYQPTTNNNFIKDMIYRTDFDHPLSFNNQTLHD